MRPLGRQQIRLLALCSGIDRALVVPDKVALSLVKRGLLKSRATTTDGFLGITPAGLRALADLMEAGKCAEFTTLPEKSA